MDFCYERAFPKDTFDLRSFTIKFIVDKYKWVFDPTGKSLSFSSALSARSPVFTVKGMSKYTWQLIMKRCKERKTSVSLCLLTKPHRGTLFTMVSFELNNNRSRTIKTFLESNCTVGFQFQFSKFFNTTNVGQREISVNIAYERRDYVWTDVLQIRDEYISDLQGLLYSKKFSDFTLRVRNNSTIPVHKCIMAARSKYFRELFDKKKNLTSVPLEDFESDIIFDMVSFIYTGSVEFVDSESCLELLKASVKYGLDELKLLCADFLCTVASKNDAMKLYDVGKEHTLLHLLESCVKVFEAHKEHFLSNDKGIRFFRDRPGILPKVKQLNHMRSAKVDFTWPDDGPKTFLNSVPKPCIRDFY